MYGFVWGWVGLVVLLCYSVVGLIVSLLYGVGLIAVCFLTSL